MLAGWALVLLSTLVQAAPTPPRVDLTGEMTVAQGLERAGRQLNRKLVRWWNGDPKLQTKVDFQLRGATLPQTLAAFEQALGIGVERSGRFVYAFGNQLTAPLALQEVDGWRIWLRLIDVQRNAVLWPGSGTPVQRTSTQQVILALEAPHDAEQLALTDATVTAVETGPGQPLPVKSQGVDASFYHRGTWVTAQLPPWPEGATELSRLTLELTFAELNETVLKFDPLSETAPRTVAADGLSATITRRGAGNYELVVGGFGLAEPAEGAARSLAEARRQGRLEALATDAAGRSLLTLTQHHWTEPRAGVGFDHGVITFQEDKPPTPARCVVRARRLGAERRRRTLVFEHLPLPPTRGER